LRLAGLGAWRDKAIVTVSVTFRGPFGRLVWRWLHARREPQLDPRKRRLRRIDELYAHLRDCQRRMQALRVEEGRSIAELDDLVYAEAGQWVTCERGHRIARFGRTVLYKDAFRPDVDLVDWLQPQPPVGSALPQRCNICNAPWAAKKPPQRCAHHFEREGWR
jgi:hypothetical protein